ncbi:hypothetical protein PV10_05914 [Exophiala mesophila]|uniref:Dynein light intermediate chain n=1 Tax=Exophiala mesophila TaxID=212818 RepID=A0A0D1ZBN0_EXOME|nr:uncharacterized protein PV10_05914 [Exophiala mesophila]KIV91369.1 hypothetical protein PV10_05914 [Exophiala mesophila]
MLTASQPVSALSTPSATTSNHPSLFPSRRPASKDGDNKALWVPMLNRASKGKDLSEKQLLLLGGTPDQQREFLEQLNPQSLRTRFLNTNDRRRQQQQSRSSPVSNRYALGYTYHDVLDADQEDILARLNIHMLSNPSASFAPLLKSLLTPNTVKDTLITILLDWSDPFRWARQLRQWIRLLRGVILSLDEATKVEMEETMMAWEERRVGPDAPSTQPGGTGSTTTTSANTNGTDQKASSSATVGVLPGPGEWDEGLGIPLSVVCIQAEKTESLERDHGWGDDQFDFLMQWLRSVLLKHGASLVYTSTFDPNNIRTLIHSSLSIHSLLKREVAKHNIVERDKILIPPNWDSWGKIRLLNETFDPESVSNAWSVEIQAPPEQTLDLDILSSSPTSTTRPDGASNSPDGAQQNTSTEKTESAVQTFEATLINPSTHRPSFHPRTKAEEPVTVRPLAEFLQDLSNTMDRLKAEDEKAEKKARKDAPLSTGTGAMSRTGASEDGADSLSRGGMGASSSRMAEHIGPYQINVNGIDFDAEEATRRIQERIDKEKQREGDKERNGERGFGSSMSPPLGASGTPMGRSNSGTATDGVASGTGTSNPTASSTLGGKQNNEPLRSFFDNLINKKDGKRGGSSVSASPTRGPGTHSPSVRGAGKMDDERRRES